MEGMAIIGSAFEHIVRPIFCRNSYCAGLSAFGTRAQVCKYSRADLQEAGFLGRLLRLPLFGVLALGVSSALRWLALPAPVIIEHGVALIAALVAVEFCLRGLVFFFVPMPPLEHRRSHADSLVVGLLRLERPSFTAMSVSVTRQFGIDLSRSWALGFIRRAAVPAVIGLAIFGWLLTGVTALDMSSKGCL